MFKQLTASKSFKDKEFSSIFYADDNLKAVNGVAAKAKEENISISILHWPKDKKKDGYYLVAEQHIQYAVNAAVTQEKGVILMNKENASKLSENNSSTPSHKI